MIPIAIIIINLIKIRIIFDFSSNWNFFQSDWNFFQSMDWNFFQSRLEKIPIKKSRLGNLCHRFPSLDFFTMIGLLDFFPINKSIGIFSNRLESIGIFSNQLDYYWFCKNNECCSSAIYYKLPMKLRGLCRQVLYLLKG